MPTNRTSSGREPAKGARQTADKEHPPTRQRSNKPQPRPVSRGPATTRRRGPQEPEKMSAPHAAAPAE
jgi:hypothetical protein